MNTDTLAQILCMALEACQLDFERSRMRLEDWEAKRNIQRTIFAINAHVLRSRERLYRLVGPHETHETTWNTWNHMKSMKFHTLPPQAKHMKRMKPHETHEIRHTTGQTHEATWNAWSHMKTTSQNRPNFRENGCARILFKQKIAIFYNRGRF